MTSAPVSALLAMSGKELHALAAAEPDDWDYLMARLKWRPDEPVPVEQMDLALELEVRYPHHRDYYQGRAEQARPGRLLAERLAASAPYRSRP